MPNLPPKHNQSIRRGIESAQSRARQSRRFYSTFHKRWRADREQQLVKQPLCEHCDQYGRVTPATEVDHINGRADRETDYTPENYQSLCKSCHSIKTRNDQAR